MNIHKIIVGPIETNCYIISDPNSKKCIIIDPGDESEKIDQYLQENNLIPAYIINTHEHYDHIGANNYFKEKYKDLKLAIHEKGDLIIKNSQINLSSFLGYDYKSHSADILLKENDLIECEKIKLKVIHTPGHTPCCICLLMDNILFSGDTLFNCSVGRTDLPQGSSSDIIKNIKEKLFILDENTKVYPGHGESTTIKNEKLKNPFF